MARPDVTDAAQDARLPPLPCFVAFGVLVGVGLSLIRVHVAFGLLIPVGVLLAWPFLRRAGYGVRDRHSMITLNAPLPGTLAPSIGLVTLLWASVQGALRLDPAFSSVVYHLGVAVVAVLCAYLARLHTLRMIAGVRELERRGA